MAKQRKSKGSSVLADAAQKAGLTDAEFASVRAWLLGLLEANEHAKLGQGGHAIGEIPLSQVFVDLPVSNRRGLPRDDESKHFFLADFFASHFQPLDSAAVPANAQAGYELIAQALYGRQAGASSGELNLEERVELIAKQAEALEGIAQHFRLLPAQVLLIGGPGQGKSTLGQLACQQYRAGLMRPWQNSLPTRQQDLIQSFFSDPAAQAPLLPSPGTLGLPLQIALPDFISWLASSGEPDAGSTFPVLFRFLAARPVAQVAHLTPEVLAALVGKVNCLLFFDGFDEVGAAKDRERAVVAIRELLTYLVANRVLFKTILTTRPQGYADELDQIGIPFEKLHLAPLAKEDALRYAEKLIQKKFTDIDTRHKIWERMQVAAAESTTTHLLATPLQVTILTSLLEKIGRAPRERWALFQKYFAHIYEREIERQTYASGLLRDHRTHIEQIHQQVGLLLQVESEQSGGATAGMARARLYEVIHSVLTEDGVEEAERTTLVHEIALAAEQRLVFLVEPEPGKFGFEIRPLQEFMAAWALSSGEDETVKNRLQRIVRAPMFDNVALFMTSRFFAEASHLREFVVEQLCAELDADRENELFALTLAGSRLALRILSEGSVLTQPKYARGLMQRACRLFQLPPGKIHVDLARINNKDLNFVLRDALTECLNRKKPLVGWICLLEAIAQGVPLEPLRDLHWDGFSDQKALVEIYSEMEVAVDVWLTNTMGDEFVAQYQLSFLYNKLRGKIDESMFLFEPFDGKEEALSMLQKALDDPSAVKVLISEYRSFFAKADYPLTRHVAVGLLSAQFGETAINQVEWEIILIFLGNLPAERDETIVGDIFAAVPSNPVILDAFVDALRYNHLPKLRRQTLLVQAYQQIEVDHPQARAIIGQLNALLQAETSGLSRQTTWHSLALPAPGPQPDPDAVIVSDIPTHPIHLQSLQLQDVRKFRQLAMSFAQPEPTRGQWIVILGMNGAGKTTLLRSLALALRNVKDPAIWREEAFVGWERIAAPDERVGPARISVGVNAGGHARQYKTIIRTNGTSHFSQDPEQHRPRLFPLFAYGCRRGSALGGATTKVKLGDSGGPEIATLFYEGADLIHAETWLIQMDGDAAKNDASKQVFNAIIAALKQLLSVDTIDISERAVWITEPGQNRMPFSFLSDGYLTSAGWFLDLIARWIDLCERHKVPVTSDFMAHMRGLVLIDEIDLHLHPRWQLDIIARTRKLLPQMSFVVSTHNPLTLVGAEPEEIWILSEEGGKVIAKQGLESPMLLTGGQIYRSYFGIADYYPAELGKALDRYSFLCTFALRSDAEEQERLALQATLRAAKMEPEWDVVPRVPLPPPPKKRARKTATKSERAE